METIFITASDTHIEVPCLVSDPELNVKLFLVGIRPGTLDRLVGAINTTFNTIVYWTTGMILSQSYECR